MSKGLPLPFQMEVEVIFRDVDAMGHVNNAVYFTYMETARTKFFMEQLNLDHPRHLPFIVAETNCTYKSAARFGEKLIIGMVVSRIGRKSFDLSYNIKSKDGRLVAIGRSVMVAFDYANNITIEIPDYLISILRDYQKGDANL